MVAEVKRKQEKKEKKKKKREKRRLEALAAAAEEVENSVLETEVKVGGCGVGALQGGGLASPAPSCCVLGWRNNGSRLFLARPSRCRAGFVGRCLGPSPPGVREAGRGAAARLRHGSC